MFGGFGLGHNLAMKGKKISTVSMRLLKCMLASLALGAGRMQHKIQSDTINLTINLAKLAHHIVGAIWSKF